MKIQKQTNKFVSTTIIIFIILNCSSVWAGDMGFFKKLFGKKSDQHVSQGKTVEEMRNDPNLIQIYDEYGQEMFITKETWRKDVLPGSIKSNWDNPDELYGIIFGALNDGFYPDVMKAAKHLYKIDSNHIRAACILGIVLMKNGKLDEAEKVLNSYIMKYGEDGVIVTNIAKIQAERGLHKNAEKTLWHALELDPNQDNAVEWWAAIHRKQSGKDGYLTALKNIAKIKGSWRAQMWLARASLEKQDFERARQYHDTILSSLDPLPSDVMMQISGDLGNAGRISEIVELFGERFDPEIHGLMVGNNLLKAYIELNDLISASKILDRLYKLNRPDWKEHLKFWEDQIDQKSGRFGTVNDAPKLSVTTLSLSRPVWAHKLSSSNKLLPSKKEDAPKIFFISATCEYEKMPQKPAQQKTDKEGSLSRAIPLFLTEQVHMYSTAKTMMLTPVISGEGSFILSAKPWEKDRLMEMAETSGADFILSGHLIAKGSQWLYKTTLINVGKKEVLDEFSHEISENDPGKDVLNLSEKVKKILFRHCELNNEKLPIRYQIPKPELFNFYLDAISQSLALSVATDNNSSENALYGERSIFDSLLDLAIRDTGSDIARLMFIGALAKNKAYGSNIYSEYQKKAEKLLRDYPLTGTAASSSNDTMESLFSSDG